MTASNNNTYFPPNILNIFQKLDTCAQGHHIQEFDYKKTVYQIVTARKIDVQGGNVQTVYYYEQKCTYGKLQTHRFPCSHAIAVCRHRRDNPITLVNEIYTTSTFRSQYNSDFQPLPHVDYWTNPSWKIKADYSKLSISRGRRREKRMQNEMDQHYREEPKKCGPSLELQEAWYQLFGDSVANGVEFVSSFIDQCTLNEVDRVNIEDEDDLLTGDNEYVLLTGDHVENLEAQKATFFSNFIDVFNKEKVPTTRQSGGSKQSQNGAKMTTKPIQMKHASCVNQVDNASVSEAVSVITGTVNEGLMTKADKLWCFAMTLFEDVVKRELFLNMSDDDGRMAWLKYKHDGGN
ncbi:hypothetical protein Tco_0610184 [Tanacetum coccineum]